MASRLIRVLCASILALSVGAAYAADKGDIRMKKKDSGPIELSNLAEESEGEVVVENKETGKAESQTPGAADAQPPAVARGEERSEAGGRDETRTPREYAKSGSEEQAAGARSPAAQGAYASGGAQVGESSVPTGGGNASSSAGSNSQTPSILPNPRPGTDQAVASTVDTSSTGNQERYAAKMVQEGAAASAAGSLSVVDNPASVRRYLATDRASYQKRLGY